MAGEKMGHVYSLTKNKTEEGILFFDEKWGHYCFLNEKGGSNFFHNIFDIFYICGELNRGVLGCTFLGWKSWGKYIF